MPPSQKKKEKASIDLAKFPKIPFEKKSFVLLRKKLQQKYKNIKLRLSNVIASIDNFWVNKQLGDNYIEYKIKQVDLERYCDYLFSVWDQ